jgi:hypothetical protein
MTRTSSGATRRKYGSRWTNRGYRPTAEALTWGTGGGWLDPFSSCLEPPSAQHGVWHLPELPDYSLKWTSPGCHSTAEAQACGIGPGMPADRFLVVLHPSRPMQQGFVLLRLKFQGFLKHNFEACSEIHLACRSMCLPQVLKRQHSPQERAVLIMFYVCRTTMGAAEEGTAGKSPVRPPGEQRRRSFVPDHVRNPQRYTCYDLGESITVGGGHQGASTADGGQADIERVMVCPRLFVLGNVHCLHMRSGFNIVREVFCIVACHEITTSEQCPFMP